MLQNWLRLKFNGVTARKDRKRVLLSVCQTIFFWLRFPLAVKKTVLYTIFFFLETHFITFSGKERLLDAVLDQKLSNLNDKLNLCF